MVSPGFVCWPFPERLYGHSLLVSRVPTEYEGDHKLTVLLEGINRVMVATDIGVTTVARCSQVGNKAC